VTRSYPMRAVFHGQSGRFACRRFACRLLAAACATALSGCALDGAPQYEIFGAFFPGWMLLALIGIAAAIAARVVFVRTGVAEVVPQQLLVCCSVGVIVALLTWLLWFRA
jgi:cation transporter-like permease